MADAATTVEETAATIAVLPNDTDADGDTLTLTGVSVPAHGTAATNPNGTVAYTPALNYSGADSFTYTITDGQGGTATGSVTVTVTVVNDAPVAVNDAYTTNEDVPLTVPATGVAANDSDPDGNHTDGNRRDRARARHADAQRERQLQLHAGGQLQRPRQLHLQGHDGTVDSNVATVSITVTAVNDAPVAVDDAYTTTEDTTLSVDAPGVLGTTRMPKALTCRRSSDAARPRHADAQRRRQLHLHAERELQRHRQLHVQVDDDADGVERRDGDDHGHAGQRRAGRGQRQLRDGGRHAADDRGARRAGQRHRRRAATR